MPSSAATSSWRRSAARTCAKLRQVILPLVEGKPLPARYKDHPLSGEWSHFRDCHIEPDWLLIYRVDGDELYLVRTGTHSDLF